MRKKLAILMIAALVLGVAFTVMGTPGDPVTPDPGPGPVFCSCSVHCGFMSQCSAWGPCPCHCYCNGYTAICGCNWGGSEL